MADKTAKKGRTNNNNTHLSLSKDVMKLQLEIKKVEEWTLMRDKSFKGRHTYTLFNAPTRKCQVINELKITSKKNFSGYNLRVVYFTIKEDFCA